MFTPGFILPERTFLLGVDKCGENTEMHHLENVTETKPALVLEYGLPGQAVDAGAG
jgi:hypothetical protein